MKFKEMQTKSDKELEELLNKAKDDLQSFRFKVAARQLKDVREVRQVKKVIAQILTLKKQRKFKKV